MSQVTNVLNTGQQSITNYDVSKYLLGFNEFDKANYTDGGAGSTLNNFVVLGKIAATGLLVECDPTAADGSQYPIGVLWLGGRASQTFAADETAELEYVNKGRVALNKLSFKAGVTIDTAITGDTRTIKDYLNTLGLVLMDGLELTENDNQ